MTYDPKTDGIDHINIYSKGKTLLGRFLSNFTQVDDLETEDGNFCSIEGYWYWLLQNDDDSMAVRERESLRDFFGNDAKILGKNLLERYGSKFSEEKSVDSDLDFQRKIKTAIKSKLDNHPSRKEELVKCTLPFKHYYVFYGKVKEPTSHQWFIEYIDQLRKEYREVSILQQTSK